jgi:CheY-like chemotaxis protein
MRILVVDDFPGAAEASGMVLRMLGHETALAMSGRDAIAQAATFQPHVVLLDIGLPDMTGHEVAAALRELPVGPGMHIVAITGGDGVGGFAKFDQQVRKPVEARVLRDIVTNAAADLARRGAIAPA